MHKYILLNAIFVGLATLLFWQAHRFIHWRTELRVLAAMVALTAIFDSLLIHIGIFDYRPEHILGVFVGKAPVEDFAYTLVAAIAVPALWRKLKASHAKPKS